MEEEFLTILRNDAGVSAIVGGRINFGAHPQGDPLPSLVLNTISGQQGYTLSGPDGLRQGRIQVDAYALTYGATKLLSRAVEAALSGYSGGGFQGVFLVSMRDERADDEGGGGTAERPFRVSMDFTVAHNA